MRILSLSLLLALTACSVAPTSSETSSIETNSVDDVVGTYAMKITLSATQKSAFLPETAPSTSDLYRLGEIVRDGEGFKIVENNCAARFPNTGALKAYVKDLTVQSIGESVTKLTVTTEAGSIKIARDSLTQVLGANLVNPASDALPTNSKDPRVIDADGDGKPGATTRASFGLLSGDIYFVQRSTNTYSASMNNDGNLKGLIQDKTEQSLIGKGSILIPSLALSPVTITQDKDASKSTVTLERISAGSTCDSVLAHYKIAAE
ncbi:MAG: hypothetical protein EOP04_16770 [Proteobacteria bacterium]|nr:MAG: hypothetical protein EOP04_16770 [Pseudomonadota bacterium]